MNNTVPPIRLTSLTTILGTVILIGGTAALCKWIWRKLTGDRQFPTNPTGEWKRIGIVSNPLCIYPIKSGKALQLNSAYATDIGFKEIIADGNRFAQGDRLFVIYDSNTKEKVMPTTYPKLLSLQVIAVSKDEVEFSSNLNADLGTLRVKVPAGSSNTDVEMWNKEIIPGIVCGSEAAKWVSLFVRGKPESLRLAYYPQNERRRMTHYFKKFLRAFPYITDNTGGAFSYLTSYHVLNSASLNDLNSRLAEADRVSSETFRPNVIVDEAEPYDEDNWKWIKIGDSVVLRVVAPATRCALTTIDPVTFQRNRKHEPLTTLKTYRLCKTQEERDIYGESPMMGVQCSIHTRGIVSVGDDVCVSE